MKNIRGFTLDIKPRLKTFKSSNLNIFVEGAVQTYEHECMDQFIVISTKQLNVIGREFQT
ncbi:hypothetical protein [Rubinisphaera sp.]|uniref:hypothetical protein n=1 Tax=Rubinisphaera sp. TaxID=2024857 RepID=UPI000C0E5F5E|nr:hypothetical protein [Rubinisphaera sp.]MBV09266.1 hypothetical protein [Rubinisphaera sp.]HCS52677.1 hypothetical protein [Planctomycetaceae bacterium]|tara:strand:- start:7529 stop:7708 length:180 start_codon:yes stop_codon:yes gene_type:complete